MRFLCSLFLVLALTGCGGARFPVGKDVVVQFDRSALGAAADFPVPPTTNGINGAATSITGRLVKVEKEWVVLKLITGSNVQKFQQTIWIPRDKVLMIQGARRRK